MKSGLKGIKSDWHTHNVIGRIIQMREKEIHLGVGNAYLDKYICAYQNIEHDGVAEGESNLIIIDLLISSTLNMDLIFSLNIMSTKQTFQEKENCFQLCKFLRRSYA